MARGRVKPRDRLWAITSKRSLGPKARRGFHFREGSGREVDLVLEDGPRLHLVEVKSGQTLDGDWLEPLHSLGEGRAGSPGLTGLSALLRHGGDHTQTRQGIHLRPQEGVVAWDRT